MIDSCNSFHLCLKVQDSNFGQGTICTHLFEADFNCFSPDLHLLTVHVHPLVLLQYINSTVDVALLNNCDITSCILSWMNC
jgi:hypothetical protein